MLEWLYEKFEIVNLGDGKQGFAFQLEDYKVVLPVDLFLQYCDGLNTPPTVAELKSVDPENTKGWHLYFDAWKEQGILN